MTDCGERSLVDHECADIDQLSLERAIFDLRVLLVEECHEFGPVMAAIALRRKNEPGSTSHFVSELLGS